MNIAVSVQNGAEITRISSGTALQQGVVAMFLSGKSCVLAVIYTSFEIAWLPVQLFHPLTLQWTSLALILPFLQTLLVRFLEKSILEKLSLNSVSYVCTIGECKKAAKILQKFIGKLSTFGRYGD